MSHWGNLFASNVYIKYFYIYIFYIIILPRVAGWYFLPNGQEIFIYHRVKNKILGVLPYFVKLYFLPNTQNLLIYLLNKYCPAGAIFIPPFGGNKYLSKYKIYKHCTSRKEVTNLNDSWPFIDTTIIEIIYGSLLGDSHAEKRKGGKGTRISFYQESSHNDYLLYLHSLIANLGFTNTKIPKITTRLGNKGKIKKIIRFHTWTYNQFNIIHDLWYNNDNKKILPNNLKDYFTPLALAIWIMNDGGKINNSLKIATNNFTFNEVEYLQILLKDIYNIDSNIHKSSVINQYIIYIKTSSMPLLANIVKPYIIPSMKYKFGKYL